jgi:hypothetical protein
MQGQEIFPFPQQRKRLWGPLSLLAEKYWDIVAEIDNSLQSSAEVTNALRYTSSFPYVFMACCLIKHMYKFQLHKLYIVD